MSYLLEILGRGLLAELAAAFRDVLRDDGHYSTAELETRVEREPASTRAHHALGTRRLADRQFGKARDAFERALQCAPEDRAARIGLACALDELGFARDAVEELRASLCDHGADGATYFALGFCLEKIGDTPGAIAAYEATLELESELRNPHERLAAIYLRNDNVGLAITHYEHLCACDPDDIAAQLALANLYVRAKRFEDAVRRFEYAITLEPDGWEIKEDLISTYVNAGQFDDALEILQGLIDERPECADLHVRAGDVHAKRGADPDALKSYEQAVALNPDYLEATVKMGTAYLRAGAFEESARAFADAIEINDRIVSAYVGLGIARLAMNQVDDAADGFDLAAEIEPNSTLLFSEMARLQLQAAAANQLDRYLSPHMTAAFPDGPPDGKTTAVLEAQIDRLHGAIEQHPTHADLHYRLGVLLRHNGDLNAARDAFEGSLRINPNYLKALVKLGLTLRDLGRLSAAQRVLERALELDPESIDLHYQLGLIFADRGEFSLALDRFEHVTQSEPQNADYVANLALALQNMGLLDRASATWHALCAMPDAATPVDTKIARSTSARPRR